jgi:WD40 repeat protein
VAWSPDNHWVASGSRDATVQVWEAQTGRLHTTFREHDLQISCLAWSPCGHQIASCSYDDEKIWIWNALTGEVCSVCVEPRCDNQCLAWSPDGKHLAAGGYNAGLIFLTTSGTCVAQIATGRRGPTATSWSPDGHYIAFADDRGHIYIRDVASGYLVWRTKAHGGSISHLAYSPDGCFLASSGYDAIVQVYESRTGDVVTTYRGHPMGKPLVRYDEPPQRRGQDPSGVVWSLAWSPDSRYLASVSGNTNHMRDLIEIRTSVSEYDTVQVWEAATGRHLQTYLAHTHQVRGVAWSPNGVHIASASLDGTIHVWNALT